ncbi:MAG TPA: TylF/MycF/NovP-related O-methyltransferase [Anaeromyxobacter sp.]|nr:TylF/MycF/NovP-related O-methyltransferase [Anaeromyxobacter sp.]
MNAPSFGKRDPDRLEPTTLVRDLEVARRAYRSGSYARAFDLFEQLAQVYPEDALSVLAELHDAYRLLPRRDRYTLYQSRHFDFGIGPADQVLDIGSGHLPFPLATHLADVALEDHRRGRAGVPFRAIEGKPVFQCSVEKMPFADHQFDFVYCSHVLEHTESPEDACRELMRVGKRGFIECPSPGKDAFLASARPSNHRWAVEVFDGRLIFSEYDPARLDGLRWDILQQMHSAPLTEREKAFSALVYLRAEAVNTMLLWNGSFEFEVNRRKGPLPRSRTEAPPRELPAPTSASACEATAATSRAAPVAPPATTARRRCFLQVHTFYPSYLSEFYARAPELAGRPFAEQVGALIADGFSGIHMFAPYMSRLGYDSHLVIANDAHAQRRWLGEHGLPAELAGQGIQEVVRRQIESLQPDVLYLSDPITFDGRFLAGLRSPPRLVLGWRAANIPAGTDWHGFDVILSNLTRLRKVALELGASSAERFHPGYPAWVNERLSDVRPEYDVVFSGQWTTAQHPVRNRFLERLAAAASGPGAFSLGLYLSGERAAIPPEVARFDRGGRFGIAMHRALRSGRIVIDARGVLETPAAGGGTVDLAGGETANMRIFEVTGSGVFLLAQHHDNLAEYFEPGVEIETFRDEQELLDKIRYYLDHPVEREAIARRGQERCLREHSMDRRAEQLDAIVRRHHPHPEAPAEIPPGGAVDAEAEAARLRDEAAALVSNEQFAEAFTLLVRAKALRRPVQGLDTLRAACFERMGQLEGAKEALLEELRFFPDNTAARERLDALPAQTRASAGAPVGDAEFRQLLEVIRPYTMLSEQRLFSLFTLAKRACAEGIPGNFLECGVAAGGSSALLAYVIKRYSPTPRRLFSFDTFSGMPPPTSADRDGLRDAEATGWGTGSCAAPERSVHEACTRVGAAEVLTSVKGLFEQTLPAWRDRVGMVALLHLDGDWYASTRDILTNLYDRLSNGALLQVDDYGHWEGCRKALHEFEASRGVHFALSQIDGTGVWFQRPDRFGANPEVPSSAVAAFEAVDPVTRGALSQMSTNERFQLYHAISLVPRRGSPLRFVEIGSYAGASLALTYMALRQAGLAVEGYCVDPGGHPGLARILKAIGPEVTHLPSYSHEAAPQLARRFGDGTPPAFMFIDGDHTYQGVRRDILDYYPLLAPGGVIAFHDFLPPIDDCNREAVFAHHAGSEPGIRRACTEVLEQDHHLSPIELPLLYPTDPSQTQPQLPIIPGVFSTFRAYQKPA